jgi:hypothetical protein
MRAVSEALDEDKLGSVGNELSQWRELALSTDFPRGQEFRPPAPASAPGDRSGVRSSRVYRPGRPG